MEISLADESMAPFHAVIANQPGTDAWVLLDNSSEFGTYVKVGDEGAPFQLEYGDVLMFAHARMSWRRGWSTNILQTADDAFWVCVMKVLGAVGYGVKWEWVDDFYHCVSPSV